MDIKKEREVFEVYMAEKYKNLMDRRKCLNNGGGYMAWDMNVAWQAWQAAKANAVPEGFVAFPKKQTSRMRTLARDFDARLSLTKYEQLHNIWVKQAMIEAQEPSHD